MPLTPIAIILRWHEPAAPDRSRTVRLQLGSIPIGDVFPSLGQWRGYVWGGETILIGPHPTQGEAMAEVEREVERALSGGGE